MVFKPSNAEETYIVMKPVGARSSTTFPMPDFSGIPVGRYGPAEFTAARQKITAMAIGTK